MNHSADSLDTLDARIKKLEQEIQERKRIEASLEKNVYRLKVLGEIKQAVLVDQSPQQFAETAFNHLKRLIPCNHSSVVLFDFEKIKGVVLAAYDETEVIVEPSFQFPLDDCYKELECLPPEQVHIDDPFLKAQPSCFMETTLLQAGIQSIISLLLISHNKAIGILNIASYQPNAFSDSDILIARDVADSLAVAIQKAMLFEQTRLKAAELETVATVSSEFRQAETWDQIIPILIRSTKKAIDASVVGFLWIEDEQLFCVCDQIGEKRALNEIPPDLGEALRELIMFDQAILTSNPQPAMQQLLPVNFEIGTVVLLPVKTGEVLIGKLFLAFEVNHDYGMEDLRLLASIVDIAGNALYRANIVETLEQRVVVRTQELATLYHVANIIGTSLNLEEALSQCLDSLVTALKAKFGLIHLLDGKSEDLVLVAAWPRPFPNAFEKLPLYYQVVSNNFPVLIKDPTVETGKILEATEMIHTYIGVPIRGHKQIIGVLSLFSDIRLEFIKDNLKLLTAAADHISIAVENDRLRSRAQDAIVIEERQRFARELHDSVSQLLYSQVLFSDAAQKLADAGDYDLVLRYLNRLSEVANQAFKEMRLMIYALRPSALESEGLIGALRHRLQTVEQRAGMETEFLADDIVKLPTEVENDLFRIAQEALNNTLKHAMATNVSVHLKSNEDEIVLTVSDNGKGFNPNEVQEGVGFSSLRERAKQLDGILSIVSTPGKGTCVSIRIKQNEKG